MAQDKQVSGAQAERIGLNPGDEAPAGTPGTGEDVCPECRGSGRIASGPCGNCGGTGKIIRAIGGA
ncbi:MAG: hypothetical protein JOZ29_10690 [Deltaproteobacteria bacterium]|nr:hypothetical protein [Deltaproteobacteria bacterium]